MVMEYFNYTQVQSEPIVSFDMFLVILTAGVFLSGFLCATIFTGENKRLKRIEDLLISQDQIINDQFVELVQMQDRILCLLENQPGNGNGDNDNDNYIAAPNIGTAPIIVPRQLPGTTPPIPPRKSPRLAMFKNNKVGQIIVSRGANAYFLDADLIFEIEFNDGTLETIKMEQLGTNATMQEFSDPEWTTRSIKKLTLAKMYPDEQQYLKGLTVSILNTDNEVIRELTVDHELWTQLEFVI